MFRKNPSRISSYQGFKELNIYIYYSIYKELALTRI